MNINMLLLNKWLILFIVEGIDLFKNLSGLPVHVGGIHAQCIEMY